VIDLTEAVMEGRDQGNDCKSYEGERLDDRNAHADGGLYHGLVILRECWKLWFDLLFRRQLSRSYILLFTCEMHEIELEGPKFSEQANTPCRAHRDLVQPTQLTKIR
jgi:hypothetical protein